MSVEVNKIAVRLIVQLKGVWQLTGENLKVVVAEFSTLN
jgi:hypothetical protein